jgi:gamma-glutamyltranspeptidase/glutathione hydrolase
MLKRKTVWIKRQWKIDINDVLKKNNITKTATGPLPVTVPGCVDGWFELHSKFGKLTMDEISPTIAYAEEGFPVSELVAYYLKVPYLDI